MEFKNKLYYGDNLEILRNKIRDNSIDLCYIDPPFNSKRTYNQIYLNKGEEDKAQAQAFIDTWEWNDRANEGFEQIMGNYNGVFTAQSIDLIQGLSKVLGKGSLLAYLVSMTLRIAEIQRVLKPTGSFYLHCDPTSSHYLKLVLDSIFCVKGGDFRNEIVWCYTAPTNTRDNFPKKHDVIFRYTKTDQWTFNYQDISIPYSEETIARTGRGSGNQGLYRSKNPEEKHANRLKPKGKIPEDWWIISRLQGNSIEKLGYPTQKPEALLERIIKASSNEGDTVMDAYCGCGTTIAVAEKLKRRWIGVDITFQSISVILRRLEDSFGKSILDNVYLDGIPKDVESAWALANNKDDRLRKEFEKWAVLTYTNNRAIINEKKGADRGIDGTAFILADRLKDKDVYKKILFSVKSGEQIKSGDIRDLEGAMRREDAVMGIFLTLELPTKPMIAESKSAGSYAYNLTGTKYPVINIVTIEEVLNGARLNIPTSHSIEVLKKAPTVKGKQFEF